MVNAIKSGFRYDEPKRFRFGCFWVEVRTKLQERLLQGIFFSAMYLVIYVYFFYLMVDGSFNPDADGGNTTQTPCTKPGWWHDPSAWKPCAFQVVRKGVAILCLLTHIPCVAICLYYVDRLDAVEETIEVTWKLKGIKQMVDAFNARMDQGEQNTWLLSAVTERTGFRKHWIIDFSYKMNMLFSIDPKEAVSHVEHITERLEGAAQLLLPAIDFLKLTPEQQKAALEQAANYGEDDLQNIVLPPEALSAMEQFEGKHRSRPGVSFSREEEDEHHTPPSGSFEHSEPPMPACLVDSAHNADQDCKAV